MTLAERHLSAIDILSASNLLNYFGAVEDVKNIEVRPILLKKGQTRVALYGLGNIRDERLYQTWAKEKKVKWLRPVPALPSRSKRVDTL